MLYHLVFFLVANALSVFAVVQLVDGFNVTGGWFGYLLVGAIIGLLNILLKPVLKILTLPLVFLTAGFFLIVINIVILWMAELVISTLDLQGLSLTIEGLWPYIPAVLVFSLVNYLFQKFQ